MMTSIKRNKAFIWGLILLITLLWGYAWVAMKDVLHYMGPFTFTSFRFGSGTLVLFLVVWLSKKGTASIKTYWKSFLIQGMLQTAIVFLLVMYGLKFVDAGKSSVLLYSMPLWSSILAVWFLKEKLTLMKLIGLIFGIVGLLTIVGWDVWIHSDPETLFGELLIIIAAISWGSSNVYYRMKLEHLPKIETNAYQMLFGTILIIIVTSFTEWHEPITLNAHSLYYIIFTGVLASALCFTVWYVILGLIDMVTATISTQLVPIFGLFFSAILLGERLSIGIIVGAGMIITGILIAQLHTGKRARNSE